MIQSIQKAFPHTIPVLAGYLSLGMAFGILLQSIGYGPVWAFFMSTLIYAGSAQFLGVELLAVGATIPQVALLTFLLNFRHFFYGLSMITKYHGTGIRRFYLIFGLTDETYALLTAYKTPEGLQDRDYYFAITMLNHCYWIAGSVLGAAAGALLTINTTGIEFAMTALFAVLVVEQWKSHREHIPALLGFAVTILALLLFGADNFLIPALLLMSFTLLFIQKKIEKGEEQ